MQLVDQPKNFALSNFDNRAFPITKELNKSCGCVSYFPKSRTILLSDVNVSKLSEGLTTMAHNISQELDIPLDSSSQSIRNYLTWRSTRAFSSFGVQLQVTGPVLYSHRLVTMSRLHGTPGVWDFKVSPSSFCCNHKLRGGYFLIALV